MTEKIDDGGPVHPRVANLPEHAGSHGLCVRDYMATAAMCVLMKHESGDAETISDMVADEAYNQVDAMIARSKRRTKKTKDQIIDEVAKEWGITREHIREILKPHATHENFDEVDDLRPEAPTDTLDIEEEKEKAIVQISLYDRSGVISLSSFKWDSDVSELPEIITWNERVFRRYAASAKYRECTKIYNR